MDSSRQSFLKCFCCSKNFNKLQLIEMNENTVLINDEEISYTDLIFDICLLKIDSSKNNNICTDCNNNLLSFHFFKRDTKKYRNFREHLEKLDILSKVEAFLDESENVANLNVFQCDNKFTISSQVEFEEENFVQLDKDELEPDETCEEFIEYDSGETVSHIQEEDENFVELNHSVVENDAERVMEKKLKSEYQAEVKASRINMITKEGPESIWKCGRCLDRRIFKSEQTFKLHLRKTHLRPTKVESSLLAECKLVLATEEGNKIFWPCPDCLDVSFKTKESLVYHIKSFHPTDVKDETAFIDVVFEEPPVKILESLPLEEFLVSDEEPQQAKKRKLNTLNDLTVDQINWIRKEVAAGEIVRGKKKAYKCTVCDCVLSTQASLTRHLRDSHVLKSAKEDKTAFKQEIDSSKLLIETSNGNETIWKCSRCENDRIYKSEQTFKIHLRMVHIRATKVDTAFIAACKTTTMEADGPREVWKCPDCMRIFRHRDTLRNHIKMEHPDMDEEEARNKINQDQPTDHADMTQHVDAISRIAKKLENKDFGKSMNLCIECGLKFATAKHHMKPKVHRECHETFKVLAPLAPHYKCDSCRIILNSETTFNDHMMVHDVPENVLPIPAEGLAQYGASYYKVPKGDADDAVDEAVWKCGHCPVRYFDENDCITHIMLLHSSSLHCFLDNREFSGSSGMSKFVQHMKNKHPELFPDLAYPCGTCKQEFPSIYEKLAHQKVCFNKKFQCDYCDKRFMTKHQLQAHILYELGFSGFNCEFCGKRCKTLSDLKIHQNVHSMARPYECSLCPKTFKTPGARSTHMEGHNDGITCEICGSKLANRTLYQRHKRFQHNQEFRVSQLEKNVCNLCGKSFLRTSHFKQHMKQQHGIQQA